MGKQNNHDWSDEWLINVLLAIPFVSGAWIVALCLVAALLEGWV